jgi:hypothetical protein
MADDPEARHDDDVHFGVAEEPQDVLVQDRVAAARRIKEGGAEIAVGQQHGDGAGQNRQRQQDHPCGDEHDHANSGTLNRVMPGARMFRKVVMMLIAPRIDDAPDTWTAKIAKSIA